MIPWILDSLLDRGNQTKKPQKESDILKSNLTSVTAPKPVSNVPPMPTDGYTAFCVNCGTPYVLNEFNEASEDLFCTGCGEKVGG